MYAGSSGSTGRASTESEGSSVSTAIDGSSYDSPSHPCVRTATAPLEASTRARRAGGWTVSTGTYTHPASNAPSTAGICSQPLSITIATRSPGATPASRSRPATARAYPARSA